MIGFCIDSNSQLPSELVDRYGVEVVPLTVTIDGTPYLEGLEIDADRFYEFFAGGRTPTVTTAAPSPGEFALAYQALADQGATEILSIHIGSAISGTLNAARLAAQASPVPVRLVDTGTASFGISCCLWEAGEAVAKGATIEEAAAVASEVAARVGNVFVVGALDLARRGGRLAANAAGDDGVIPILRLVGGTVTPIAQVADIDEAADAMCAEVRAGGEGLRVGLSVADAAGAPLLRALEERLIDAPEVLDLVRYRVGPSVGAHTGPGTAGAMFYRSA